MAYTGQTNMKWYSSSTQSAHEKQHLLALFVLLYLPVSIDKLCDDNRILAILFCYFIGIDWYTCEMFTRIKYQQQWYGSNTPGIDTSKDVTGSQVPFAKTSKEENSWTVMYAIY